MAVGKIKKYRTDRNDPIINFLSFFDFSRGFKIEHSDDLFGAGSIKLRNPRGRFPNFSNLLKNYSYLKFDALTHLESKTEGYNLNLDNFIKGTVNLEYNFLIKDYEDFILKNNTPELNLPNFYDTVNQELVKTPDTPFDGVSFFQKNLYFKYPSTPIKKYYSKIIYNSNIPEDLKRFSKVSSLEKYFKKYNPFKYSFPFYAEAVFDNLQMKPEKQSLNELFIKYDLLDNIMKYYSEKRGGRNLSLLEERKIPRTKFNSKKYLLPTTLVETAVKTSINYVNLNDYFTTAPELRLVNSNNIEFFQKLEEIVDKNKVSYEDIINNTPCYYEVVGYKIAKHNTGGELPLQEFYLPNTREAVTEFVDTQVRFGSRYRYKISLLAAAIVTDYSYTSVTNNAINFEMRPQIHLYEIDSIDYQNVLLDSPPLEPEVEAIPYIGISNKIKFNLNTAVGRKYEAPIVFTSQEAQSVSRISEAQNRKDDKILYESDEPNDYFEAFKLEQKPMSYSDFISGQKIVVDNNNSSAGSFEDNIQQNRKYYYIFRGVDYHRNISNPSPIYEVELVNENGAVYPIINILDLKDDPLKTSSKNFRRFLSISPNLGNTLIDPQKNNNFKDLKDAKTILKKSIVGIHSPGVWDKKFKIRLTSISSGKKMDINVVFNIKKEE